MEITGVLYEVLPEQRGQGKNGEWVKQSFILEVGDSYPKKVCINIWGDKIDLKSFKKGERLTASIDIESREFNGKWYTDVKAWKLENNSSAAPAADDLPGFQPDPPGNDDDDLPF